MSNTSYLIVGLVVSILLQLLQQYCELSQFFNHQFRRHWFNT